MTVKRPALNLRGKRFRPLDWDSMSPAQTRMVESVMTGKRGSMQGPYNVLLRSPELGDLAQKFGAHTRFNSSLPLALNELAILIVARAWTSQFVWWAHRAIALEAGLDRGLVDDIAEGRTPQGFDKLPSEVVAVYRFCSELQQNRKVSDATFAQLVEIYGEAGVVDLMGTMSYYILVSMALNVDQYPLPEGVVAELKPLTFSS